MINAQELSSEKVFDSTDELSVNTLRMLSVDMIQKAKSGHPGICLDAAPMAYVLWNYHMNVDPKNPGWINRDRFVLSAGHGSAMLYSLIHLSGYDLPISELKQFRQLGSKTPGHPEYGHTVGVDATTGPLGQGIGMAVGMALAEKHMSVVYNHDYDIIDHYTYAIVGDGDLMEGVSQEAINIAGKEKLDKLVVLYDSNDVTLDGPLSNESIEDQSMRFQAAGWDYLRVRDGEDLDSINRAIEAAKQTDKPAIIEIKTVIGYGSPDAGTNKVHGSALGDDNVQATREALGYSDEPFKVEKTVYDRFQNIQIRGEKAYDTWLQEFSMFEKNDPQAKYFSEDNSPELNLDDIEPSAEVGEEVATRVANSDIMQQITENNLNFWGGAADLSSSNKTQLTGSGRFSVCNPQNRNLWFGVREFGMAAALNGIALHGGTRVFGSTFFTFSDYLKSAVRSAALQGLPVTYVFTHDSIAVGEDGPTHEPIEQLAALRSMPNVNVIRPADANEVFESWKVIAKETDTPNVMVLSRQKLPVMKETLDADVSKGAYVVSPAKTGLADGILIATGSEVSLALEAKKALTKKSYDISVVSMPSMELFDRQSDEYKESVLPSSITRRISIEMESTFGWGKYVGLDGASIGIDTFGASGNGDAVEEYFGFTVKHIVNQFESLWNK
ncbi:transketolase [Paucilactobacillus suebicus]|uniref:Transketolase n=1 Tax=Paucilactobacillus suebicus DSM 5007 = KCTC 3549 TaxID=1423807 RepID=A0A0R1W1I5_9LACO|nr:transketolase [Paucilactobacillus suebicus]KRM09062.1 transketolase [Paucilactobacillus suebicus DSM 5007 = KCTC 3549]